MADIEKGKIQSDEGDESDQNITTVKNTFEVESNLYTVVISGDEDAVDRDIIVPEEINQKRFKNLN